MNGCSVFGIILPKSYKAEKFLEEGVEAAQSGKWEKALAFFLNASKLVDDPRILNDIGLAYLNIGDEVKAIRYLVRAVKREPDNVYFLLNLAVAYDRAKKYGLALEIYNKILQVKPGWVYVSINKAYTLSNLKKLSDAVKIYKGILQKDPENLFALSSLGGLYARIGQYDKALELYKRILSKYQYPEIYLAMGAIYELKNDFNRAIVYYNKSIKLNPDFSLAYFLYGDLKIKIGDIKEGVKYLEKSVELAKKGYEAPSYVGGNYFILAGMEESIGDDKTASYYYRKAFSLYPVLKELKRPVDVDAMLGLAIFLKDSDKLDEAEKKVKEMIAVDPKDPLAYSLLGDIYYLKGEMGSIEKRQGYYKKAISNYKKSLSLDSNQSEVYVKLGNIYFAQGKLEVVYYKQGKFHQAYLNYREAIRLNPADPMAHLSLGLLYGSEGEYSAGETSQTFSTFFYSKAITELTLAMSNGLKNFYVYYLIGYYYYKRHASDKDLRLAEFFTGKSIELNPEWSSPLYLMARIYLEKNEKRKARETLSKIKPHRGQGKEVDILTYLILLTRRGGKG